MGKYDKKIKDISCYKDRFCLEKPNLEYPNEGEDVDRNTFEERQISELICAIYSLANEISELNKKEANWSILPKPHKTIYHVGGAWEETEEDPYLTRGTDEETYKIKG